MSFFKYITTLFLAMLTVTGSAQPYVDVVKAEYQHFLGAPYHENGSTLLANQFKGSFFLPLKQANQDIILTGGSFDRLYLHRSAQPEQTRLLYSTALQAGYLKRWNDRWQTLLLGIGRLNSDYKEMTTKHLQIGGVVLFTYAWKGNLKFKAGLYYNREFFGNFFMPLGGVDWDLSDRTNIFGVLPGEMNIEYRLADRWFTGLTYHAITASYRLSDYPNFYIREGHTFWGHNQLRAFLDYYPYDRVAVFFDVGHTAWRQYDLYTNRSDTRIRLLPVFNDFRDGLFLNVGISFRVRTDEAFGGGTEEED